MTTYSSCAALFFIFYTRYALGTLFSYAAKRVENIRERSISYVQEERPLLYDQCLHSNVCSDDVYERWTRCEEAVQIDACRHQGIALTPGSTFTHLKEPKVYGFVLFGEYEDITLACACPTEPKLILLADAQGYSVGDVNVIIYEPKSLTKKQQLDAYASKFTDKLKDVLPGGAGKSEDQRSGLNDDRHDQWTSLNRDHKGGYYKSDYPDKLWAPPTQELGTHDKFTDKVKNRLRSESKVDKSYIDSPESGGGFFNDPPNVPSSSAAETSADVKKFFWQRKKKTTAAAAADVESENVDEISIQTELPSSFEESRFGSFNSAGSGGEDEHHTKYERNTSSPDSPPRENSERGEDEPDDDNDDDDDDDDDEFENPFANVSTGQSSAQSQATNESSDTKKLSKRRKIKAKVKSKVKKWSS